MSIIALKAAPLELTVAELVDAFGAAIAKEAAATAERKELRAAIESLGKGAYDGRMFRATVSTNPVKRISPDLVRELLSAEDVALVTVEKPETRVSCKSLKV
jgi:plasmid stabilization system protein ParE